MDLKQLQKEQKLWVEHNFIPRIGNFTPELLESVAPLLGALEELGELAHSHLKQGQNIRVAEKHVENAKDAIGDIVIYLSDYCSARNFNFGDIVKNVWGEVKKRDWKKNNKTGVGR